MKTLGEVLALSADFLKTKGIARPRRQAEELLADLLELARIELYMHFDRPLEEAELESYRGRLRRAAKGEPWAYICGKVDFLGCKIRVNPGVLIPRPETELLAERVLQKTSEQALEAWDLCCGSGCIGLALKKARPSWSVTLSDISEKAVATARQNGEENGLEALFLQGDLLGPFCGRKADVVVCNPPYIREEDYAGLDPSVRDFEPKIALTAQEEGFFFYRRLSEDLPAFLNPGAKLFFEIGTGMGEGVKKIFSSPCWSRLKIDTDYSGHERFFSLEFE